jgi:hypothetical protein
MVSVTFIILAGAVLVVVLAGSSARARGTGEGTGMRRFWTIVLLIGVVFAVNLVIRVPHPTRHHRTLLPPKPVAPVPVRVEVPAIDEDDPPVKVATAPKSTRSRVRVTKVAPATPVTPTVPAAAQVLEWHVSGEPSETKEEAWQSALEKARDELTMDLRLHAPLDPEFIHQKMVRASSTQQIPIGGQDRPDLKATKVELELELKPEVRDELARSEREYRVQERMAWLARLLAAAVVLLGAVGAYVRLDEWTKGYYTGRLRLALGLGATAAATAAWLMV